MKEEFIKKFKQSKKSGLKLLAITAVVLTLSTSFSGCVKNVDCDVDVLHAHKYVHKTSSFCKYVSSEKEYLYDFYRTDDYVAVDKEKKEFLDYLNDHNLYNILENEEVISKFTKAQDDFLEYEYEYEADDSMVIVSTIDDMITTTVIPGTVTKKAWTTDRNHEDLTGNIRMGHYLYQAYKISKNEKGKYVETKSKYVDNLDEIRENYPYIKSDFYTIVYDTDQKSIDQLKEKIKTK